MKKQLFFLVTLMGSSMLKAQDGALDSSFAGNGIAYVRAVQKLSTGKIIATHSQSSTGGILLLNDDGSVNSSTYFGTNIQQTGTFENFVQDIVEQPDGKILFVGSRNAPRVFRYNADGTIDNTFQTNLGTGANNKVRKAVIDGNGKITLIGNFTSFNGTTCGGIIRLNADGTIDNTFTSTGTTSSTGITDIILTPDNKYILTGENISVYNGQSTYRKTVRLKYNGTIDSTFQAPQDGNFIKIGLLSNGKIVGVSKYVIMLLNANGSYGNKVTSIAQGNSAANIAGVHVQSDDKVIITGTFNKIGTSTNLNCIARIDLSETNITVDENFNPGGSGPSHEIYCSQLTDNGKILIGGVFYQYNGTNRDYVARLKNSSTPLYPENLTSTSGLPFHNTSSFSIFPNPVSDIMSINTELKGAYSIYSLDGKMIKQGLLEEGFNTINLSIIPSGSYLFEFNGEHKTVIKQ